MEYRLGMVLSGGGSRGLAHMGVLKALTEEGIEPDCIAATSAGAIVAALYAAGYDADEVLHFFATLHPYRISKLALRKPGIIDTEKSVADFLAYLPDDSFEALGKRLFLTATDLVGARLEIFSSGPLIRVILASSSAPMIFTPTEIDGRWYSDKLASKMAAAHRPRSMAAGTPTVASSPTSRSTPWSAFATGSSASTPAPCAPSIARTSRHRWRGRCGPSSSACTPPRGASSTSATC